MDKLAMISLLIVTVAAPAAFARDADARRGVRRMLLFFFAFIALYAGYVAFVHTVYDVPQAWAW